MGVDFSEVVALRASLAAVPGKTSPAVEYDVNNAARATLLEADQLVPIETSTLAESITAEIDEDGLGFVAGPEVYYGHFVEDGDYNNAPQPFMGPAFDHQVDEFCEDLADTAADLIR